MSLPFIPSSLQDSTRDRKKSTLIYKNGYAVPRPPSTTTSLVGTQSALETQLTWDPELTYTVVKKPGSPVDKLKATTPEHESLAFEAYFTEKVLYSQQEQMRVRRVTIIYFLRDGAIQINERREQNSGLPQGVLLKRQRVTRPDGEPFRPRDFLVGNDVVIFGRTYHVSDADFFTRTFFADRERIELAPPQTPPEDSGTLRKKQLDSMLPPVSPTADKLQLKKFLDYDRKVLRFFCVWDNRSQSFGERRPYTIHFFLVDDTVEIREVPAANSGHLPFPIFLRRQKLTYNGHPLSDADFRVGETITLMARPFFIHDCDAATKDYYKGKYNMDIKPVQLPAEPDTSVKAAPITDPALFLIPRPPKKNFQKMLDNDRKILRYAAALQSDKAEDASRSFVVSFYLADDTLSIYEPPQRNSGVLGGKFLERRQVQKPNSKEFYRESDFFVGAVIEVFNHRFSLRNADDYAFNYMEANTDLFPASDIDLISKKLKAVISGNRQLSVDDIREAFAEFDRDQSGTISLAEFKDVVRACGFNLSEQEMVTLMRRFDLDGDGQISYNEFALVLES